MGFPQCSWMLVDSYIGITQKVYTFRLKLVPPLSSGSRCSAGYRTEKNSLCAYNKLGGCGCISKVVNKVGVIRK